MTQASDTDTADRELVITRLIDAPRERVFEAWTTAEHLAKWWGPQGFSVTTHHFDFRAGGVWRYVMHGPDGRDYENRIVYKKIDAPQRIEYLHDDGGEAGIEEVAFFSTASFEPAGEGGRQTRLTLRMVFPTAEERERVAREYGAVQGGVETVTRLAEHVVGGDRPAMVSALPSGNEVVMIRRFNAPAALVFKAFTDPAMLKRWMFAFEGHALSVCEVDLRVGGALRYVWTLPGGKSMGLTGRFLRVEPGRLLEHTELFDEDWTDGEAVIRTEFSERDGRTTVTMTSRYKTTAARDAVREHGMEEGVEACYTRLDRLIAEG